MRTTGLALLFLTLVSTPSWAESDDASNPLTWPVVFQEVYELQPREGTQLPLEPEGMNVRSFFVRVEADAEIEAKVTRAHDESVLWFERRTREASALIPWGRDEEGTISLFNRQRPDGQRNPLRRARILVSIAVDPAERDEPVHSYYVNRFLEAFEEDRTDELVPLLEQALAQDPDDETASKLLARITGADGKSPGVAESRVVARVSAQVDSLERARDMVAIDALIADPPELETATGNRRWNLLLGRLHLRREQPYLALQAFYRAFEAAPDLVARFEVYPWLIDANRAVGNTQQADRLVEQASAEAPDDATRRRVEIWRAPVD